MEIKQDFEYEDDDWWEWSVWIESSEEELDEIEFVEYTLHPTFPKPVRIIRDRRSKFRLESAGWGVFTIYAKVVFKDGRKRNLKHYLELLYPDGTPTFA